MAAPALKDLPKVAIDLKSQLEGFSTDKLKNIDTQEKIILPSAEGRFWSTLAKWFFFDKQMQPQNDLFNLESD